MDHTRPLAAISDDELLRRLVDLVRQSRRAESDLVAHIAEVERRRLYAREASPSMFVYCTQVLHLSESEAYARITAARASFEHPMLLEMLADGRIHLTGIARLAPHLTLENRADLLSRATHKSRRQIEELIAEIAPRPDVAALMRKLPARREFFAPVVPVGTAVPAPPRPELCPDRVESSSLTLGAGGDPGLGPAGPESSGAILQSPASLRAPEGVSSATLAWQPTAEPPDQALALASSLQLTRVQPIRSPAQATQPTVVEPLGNARYKVQFTASAELHHKLERLRALMRSQVPDGDLAAIIDKAVSEKLDRLESRRFAKTGRPRRTLSESDPTPASRHIPAAVRRAVHARDGGRCRYVDEDGPEVLGARPSRVPPPAPVRHGGRSQPEQHPLDVSGAQRLPGRARLWTGGPGFVVTAAVQRRSRAAVQWHSRVAVQRHSRAAVQWQPRARPSGPGWCWPLKETQTRRSAPAPRHAQ